MSFRTLRRCSACIVLFTWFSAVRPGIGPEVAEAVLRAHPTPFSLFTAYRTAMQQARAQTLP